ncbi:hypothetical protein Cgig2_027886 [Carnegiea gigantea]|uniref:Uncharacterized protein n=1 Tax=Carnegiea gigantea TaxID=171969 RepID=A0A9Q1KLG6_9CARY|nr:hypothetical protein Cgig2_027886 [Carnegiea gigantea]
MAKERGDIIVATLPCGFPTVRGQKFELVSYKIQHQESHQHNLELNRTRWHVITAINPNYSLLRVGDFIDKDKGEWRVDVLELVFLPVDVELIKSIPLSCSWARDRIVCHFATNRELPVKTAYHFIQQKKTQNILEGSDSKGGKSWSVAVNCTSQNQVTCIEMLFLCITYYGRLARRILNFAIRCSVCDAFVETDEQLTEDQWANFVVITWSAWNTRNKYLFEEGFSMDTKV